MKIKNVKDEQVIIEDMKDNSELVKAIDDFRNNASSKESDSIDKYSKVLELFTQAEFLIPTILDENLEKKIQPENKQIVVNDDKQLKVRLLSDDRGNKFIPVFTSWEKINNLKSVDILSDKKHSVFGDEIKKAFFKMGLMDIVKIINMGTSDGIIIDFETLDFIMPKNILLEIERNLSQIDGKIEVEVIHDKEINPAVSRLINEIASNNDHAIEMYIKNIKRDNKYRTLVIVRSRDEDEFKQFIKKLSNYFDEIQDDEIISLLSEMDFIPYDSYSEKIINGEKPFFKR